MNGIDLDLCIQSEQEQIQKTRCRRYFSIFLGNEVFFSRSFVEGLIPLIRKDEGIARSAFVAACVEQDRVLEAQPNNSRALGLLGLPRDWPLLEAQHTAREHRQNTRSLVHLPAVLNGLISMIDIETTFAFVVSQRICSCEHERAK